MSLSRLFSIALFTVITFSSVHGQFLQNRWHTQQFRSYPASEMDSTGVPVRQGTYIIDWNRTVTNGPSGSWYYAWDATPNGGVGVYAGRISNNGDTLWKVTVNDGPERQEDPVCLGTPDGGVVIAWVDYRRGFYGGDSIYFGDGSGSIMAQKLDSLGHRLWNVTSETDTINAIPVCFVYGNQNNIRAISDGADGVYIFWEDTRNNLGQDIYGTRVLANGTIATGFRTNGNAVAADSSNQPANEEYTIDSDGRSGAWIAWTDYRRHNSDIYIQQLCNDGTTRWDSTGHPFDTTNSEQSRVKLAPDGRGGAFLIWRNSFNSTVDLCMQRIDSVGVPMWYPDSGIALGTWANDQTNPQIISAGQDTCIVVWEDFRNDPSNAGNEDVYAQKVTGDTNLVRVWNTNGVAVCMQNYNQREIRLTNDGLNGCVIVWLDERPNMYGSAEAPNEDVYAQYLNSEGIPQWMGNGMPIAAQPGSQTFITANVNNNRIMLAWIDSRKGSYPIYTIILNRNGTPITGFTASGRELVGDINGNINKNSIIPLGKTRFANFWVDGRFSQYGNRVYYEVSAFSTSATDSVWNITAPNGTPVSIDSTNTITQDGTLIYSDLITVATPDSGAIVIYLNIVNGHYTMRAQRISYNGNRMWGHFGVEVCAQVTAPDYFSGAPDGSGGAYFAYTIAGGAPDYYNEVHCQHIDANGNRLYSDTGVDVTPGHEQTWSAVAVSGSNVYLGLIEVYDIDYNLSRVRVLKLNSDGSANWTRTIITGFDSLGIGSIGSRVRLRLIPGSNGSVVAHWEEFRFDVANGSGQNIYSQTIDSTGAFLWGTNGVRIGASTQAEARAFAIQSGNSYWFAWNDYRDYNYPVVYVQHLAENGIPLLDSVGYLLQPTFNITPQIDKVLSPDGEGGVYVFYNREFDTPNPFPPPESFEEISIIGTHLQSDGSVYRPDLWFLRNANNNAFLVRMDATTNHPVAIPTYSGNSVNGAIVAWIDFRATHVEEMANLYMQRVRDDFVVSVREVSAPVPKLFTLYQNYPNPFNPTTTFRFTLPRAGHVKFTIYDVLGREVVRLLDDVKMTGTYELRWNGKNNNGQQIASGTYFYRLESGGFSTTKKMVLLR